METTVQENEILVSDNDKVVGRLVFELNDNVLSILHTYAYESGRGIGSILMKAAVAFAEDHRYTILPVCPFADEYLCKTGRSVNTPPMG